jgi:hypothetical protein
MSQFEQLANIKFMCRLGKSASEMLSALQQVYGDTAVMKSQFTIGFSGLRMDRRSWRMTIAAGGLQHPETPK